MTPELNEAIRSVLGVSEQMGIKAVLIGALVTELVAKEEGLPQPRGTNDADFALRLKDWGQFDAVKDALKKEGFRQDPQIEHRLHRKDAKVDVLPYGSDIAKDGEYVWPVAQQKMVVLGFEEACAEPVDSESEGLRISRLTIPALVLLKIVAFVFRQATGDVKHKNDAEDILYWMNHYAGGKQQDRRYTLSTLGLGAVEFTEAGAALLGIDVRKLASTGTHAKVQSFLEDAVNEYGKFIESVLPAHDDSERSRMAALSGAFKAGYER